MTPQIQTLGKILGALGALLLFSSPVTLFVSSGSMTATLIKALLGLALIGVAIATNYHRLLNADAKRTRPAGEAGSAMGQGARAGFFYLTTLLIAVVAVAGVAAANFIVAKRNKTWDLTNKKIYSLAPQTVTTLKGLKQPVKAIGFVPTQHPAYDALEQLLKRYHDESERFTYEFKDPRKTPDLAAKYQLKEGQTTVVLTRGEGEAASHTALNMVSEQELTNALVKIDTVGQLKVYFVVGHGEWSLEGPAPGGGPDDEASMSSVSELKQSLLQEGYAPEALNLVEKRLEVPRDASLLVVAGPKSALTEPEVGALRTYLAEGGRLMFFGDANGEVGPSMSTLLGEYGVALDQGLVADSAINPSNPYVVVTPFFGDHEITRILKQLQMNVELPTVRGLSVLHQGLAEGVNVSPVVTTSPYAWVESKPVENPSPSDGEKTGAIPVVVASSRPTAGAQNKRFDEARLVVFGDSELLVDALWGHEPNRNLAMNAFAWGSAQVTKITIRPPDRDLSSLDVDEDLMSRIRFVAIDLLPLSLIGVGLAIWMARRSK